MRKIVGVLVLGIAILFIGCANAGDQKPVTATETVNKITAEEAKARLDTEEEIILVDVRTQEEYDMQHIPNALLLPLDDISEKAAEVIPDKEAVYFVYCRSGNRSGAASAQLVEMGYVNIYDLGGLNHWPYEMVKRE